LCHRTLPDLISFPTRRSSDLVLEGSGNKRRVNGGPAIAVYLSIAQMRYRPDADVRLTEQNAWNLEYKSIGVPILEKVLTGIGKGDRKSTRLNSSHEWNSYAVF